jgi:hypothetical protein
VPRWFSRALTVLMLAGALVVLAVGAGPGVAHPKCGVGVIEPGEHVEDEAHEDDGTMCNEIEIDAGASTYLELGEPPEQAVGGDQFGGPFVWSENMTPVGFSARYVPTSGTGANLYNSDLAFWGNRAYQGTYAGFRILDISNPADPVQLVNYTGCSSTAGQGDVVVWENLLIRSYDAPATATATCGGQLMGSGFEGISIFDVSNPSSPQFIRNLRMASSGNAPGAPSGCGSHTATAVPDPARGNLYLYVGGSSGSCTGMDVVRISIANPMDAVYLRRAGASRQCHDNNVIFGEVNLAVCAGGNGFSVFSFDPSINPSSPGGIEFPTLLYSRAVSGVSIGHSGSFSYDGKYLIFGHEPGGGSQAQCQASSSTVNKSLFFFEATTGTQLGTFVHPRPQLAQENCTWHNFNVIPTKLAHMFVSGNYQSGIIVGDFTNPSEIEFVAYADPGRLGTGTGITLGGDWSTYWYNGYIYESDIRRGILIWKLDDPRVAPALTFGHSNPQTQTTSFELDVSGPEINVAVPLDGAEYAVGSTVLADYECVDPDLATCVGTVPSGSPIDTSVIGFKTFTIEASDTNGNTSSRSITYNVVWPFTGFFDPIGDHNDEELIRPSKAGTVIPVRFSLGGDRGLDILWEGYPTAILPGPGHGGHGGEMGSCEYPTEVVDPAASAGGTGLQYRNGQYLYLWETDEDWAGECRMLIVKLKDNTEHWAMFMFEDEPAPAIQPFGQIHSCNGLAGEQTVPTDLTVSPGATCTLRGTRVNGILKVRAGATLLADGVHVTRNLECLGTCVVLGTSVNHLTVEKAAGLAIVSGSTVRGSAECNDCAALDLTGSAVTGGVASVRQLQPGIYCGNTIGGTLSFRWSTQPFTTCQGNVIGDKLELSHNSGNTNLNIVGNQVSKNIRLEKNHVGAISLVGNTAGNAIVCLTNTPTPTASGNTASSIDAACGQS